MMPRQQTNRFGSSASYRDIVKWVLGCSAAFMTCFGSAASAQTGKPSPALSLDAVEQRLDALEASLDRVADLIEKRRKSQKPDLEPGWVVRTYLLSPSDYLKKPADPLSAFVVDKSEFNLNAHLAHSPGPKDTMVAYELSGLLQVDQAGRHSIGLLIGSAQAKYDKDCAARISIEGNKLLETPAMTTTFVGNGERPRVFDPVIGGALLEPGLYEANIWIGCSYDRSTKVALPVTIISQTPSQSAPDILDISKVGHRQLKN